MLLSNHLSGDYSYDKRDPEYCFSDTLQEKSCSVVVLEVWCFIFFEFVVKNTVCKYVVLFLHRQVFFCSSKVPNNKKITMINVVLFLSLN